ncbi:hypothetical protein PoB_005832600, partial [Plakobranchus ocellatus]
MTCKGLLELVHVCRQKWPQLVIILLVIIILALVAFIAQSRHSVSDEGESDNGQTTPDYHSIPSYQRVSDLYKQVNAELAAGENLSHSEEEKEVLFQREFFPTLNQSAERGVREVRDLPLLLLRHKLQVIPGRQCPHNLSSLEEEAARRVRKRKSFLYMHKLYQAMATETERADLMEDMSSANWAIRAYAPVQRTQHSVLFRRTPDNQCHMTRLEFLISAEDRENSGQNITISATVQG